jgi:pyrroline-5-carboxylate reductase
MQANLFFIGAGNMAASLIGGLISGGYPCQQIEASDPNEGIRSLLHERFNILTREDNQACSEWADIIILAVKPQIMKTVCQQLANYSFSKQPLFISVAAGVRCEDINEWLGGNRAIVRAMPNTPALIQAGATGLFANEQVNDEQKEQAENILRAAGVTLWLTDEKQLDAVTALSGSGPAYYFLFMEAMQAAGKKLGLDEKTARLLTLQTALGAAKMALESTEDCATLRRKVTSPNGTTEKAIQTFESLELAGLVEKAMQAAYLRAQQLGDELGGKI